MRSAFSTTIFVSVFLGASFLSPAHALRPPSETDSCSSFLAPAFFTHPSRIEWKVDHRPLCPVTRQGMLSTCWASAGVTWLQPLLLRSGLIPAGQRLSPDYYSALVMRAFAELYRRRRGEILMEEIGPYYTTEIYPTLLQAGVVLEGEFRLPRLPIESRNGTRYAADLRSSRRLQEDFIDELNEAKRSRSVGRYAEVLDHYLGIPDPVRARPVPAGFLEANRPALLVTNEEAHRRILEENLTSTLPERVPPEEAELRVRQSLDRGNPVLVTISRLEHFARMARMDFAATRWEPDEGEYPGEHAVALVGWGIGADGGIWYLLQNSSGKGWGANGTIAVSGGFLRSEIEKFVVLGP